MIKKFAKINIEDKDFQDMCVKYFLDFQDQIPLSNKIDFFSTVVHMPEHLKSFDSNAIQKDKSCSLGIKLAYEFQLSLAMNKDSK